MILYPTTVLFQVVATIERALKVLQAGKSMESGISLSEYEKIVGLDEWSAIENRFQHGKQTASGG